MEKTFSVAILNLENELNVGSIVRTANAAGADEILIIGKKKWNKSAATGAQRKTKLRNIKTSDEFLEYSISNNYKIISLEISKNSKNIFDFDYPEKTMLVVGNEGKGVSEKILAKSDSILTIPQYGDVECLNVAVSAGIAIYDWVRKNKSLNEKNIKGNKFKDQTNF